MADCAAGARPVRRSVQGVRLAFPTLPFVALFLLVLSTVWAMGQRRALRNVTLIAASYFFYAGLDWRLAALLGGSSIANWWLGERIAASQAPERGRWTFLGVALNVAFLGVFKYLGFFLENLQDLASLMGLGSHVPVLELLLPVGVSFYTFQSIAYLVDLHRGYGHKAKSLPDYLLFISFFPQLLIGPICRSRDLLPQIEAPPPRRIPNLSLAVVLLAGGVFKKVVLATYLQTHLVDDVFLAPENYGFLELMMAAYGYTIQLYCDFSGYTDMARGLGLLLGFHLPENFNQPYRSTSIAEFWRRWHMTFGHWLRDYLYFPLGGGRRSPPRVYLNLMITLMIAGIWHGAHYKFLLWGGVHGLALVAHKVLQDVRRLRGQDPKKITFPAWYVFLAWAYTFHLCVLARILFRSPDLEVAGTFAWGLVDGMLSTQRSGPGVEWLVFVVLALGLGLNFFGHHLRRWAVAAHDAVPAWARPAVWAAVGLGILTIQPDDVAPFVYFQF
ncbi:MAG: MBOAT family protein [Deltaproteobacteria bacterium]|nr:MAG: MBOAT family protein [Deltaproteobacteria bacterium]